MTFLGGGGNPAAYYQVDGERQRHDGTGEVAEARAGSIAAIRTSGSFSPRTSLPPADAWWYAIDTISNSEAASSASIRAARCCPVVARRPRAGRRPSRCRGADHAGSTAWRDGLPEDDADRRHARRTAQVTRGRLAVHGHFYQPAPRGPVHGSRFRASRPLPRITTGTRGSTRSATAPTRSAETSNAVSFDIGPTLASWLAQADPADVRAVPARRSAARDDAHGQRDGAGVPPHDPAPRLAGRPAHRDPLGHARLRAAVRPPAQSGSGCLKPRSTSRPCASSPRKASSTRSSRRGSRPTRRSTRVGRTAWRWAGADSMAVAFYDGALSARVSFDPGATADADQFVRDRSSPRFGRAGAQAGRGGAAARRRSGERPVAPARHAAASRGPRGVGSPMVVIATDGEFYGHHQKFRDLFLQRLIGAGRMPRDPAASTSWRLSDAVRDPNGGSMRAARIAGAHVLELPSRRRALERGMPRRRRRTLEGPAARGVRAARRRASTSATAERRFVDVSPASTLGRARRLRGRGLRRRAADAFAARLLPRGQRPPSRAVPDAAGGTALATGDVRE